MMDNSQVCDLRPIILFRFFFGHHIKLRSPTLRFLSKLYGVFFVALIIYCGYYTQVFGLYFIWSTCSECIMYILISWTTEEKYLLQFYKRISALDSLPCAPAMYKKLSRILTGVLIGLFFWRILNVVQFLVTVPATFPGLNPIIPVGLISFARDAGLYNIIMIFSITYVRIIIIRKTIEDKGFEKVSLKKYSARQYVHMYEIVADTLNEVCYPLKLMIFTLLSLTLPRTVENLVQVISAISEDLHYSVWLILVTTLIYNYGSIIGSVIILDLTHDELKTIQGKIFEKILSEGIGERELSELQLFLNMMNEYPLQFTVWRVLPFTLRVSLNLVSYCIITVMAVMQIRTFYLAS